VLGAEGRKSPAWLEIKNRVTEQAETAALLELGITPDVLASPARQEALVSILPEQDEETCFASLGIAPHLALRQRQRGAYIWPSEIGYALVFARHCSQQSDRYGAEAQENGRTCPQAVRYLNPLFVSRDGRGTVLQKLSGWESNAAPVPVADLRSASPRTPSILH
jgi:hypothetical protein